MTQDQGQRRKIPWQPGLWCLLTGLLWSWLPLPGHATQTTAAPEVEAVAAEIAPSTFHVREAHSLLVDGVYRVSAQVDYRLGTQALDALEHGVPLVLELHIELAQQREWLWSEVVAQLRQRYQLRYHALSRRYLVHSFNSGVQLSYDNLGDALHAIGNLYDLPVLDERLLQAGGNYEIRLRADLDIEELPTPIRLWAYLSSGWSVVSEWYVWPLER